MRHTRDAYQNETTNGQTEIKAIVWLGIGSSADSQQQHHLWGWWRVARAAFDDLTLFSMLHSGGSKWSMQAVNDSITISIKSIILLEIDVSLYTDLKY